jgi:hypothetical protein
VIRKGDRPPLRVRFGRPAGPDGFTRVFPFRRPWPVIAVLGVMFAIFMVPAVATGRQVAGELAGIESLFDLVGAAFLGFWLLGWSVGVFVMGAILVLLLFGREVLHAGPEGVEIVIGLPFVGLAGRFDVGRMRNLRVADPAPKSGLSWRGRHFAFDYGASTFEFGSQVDALEQGAIASAIQMASGKSIRKGAEEPEDSGSEWEPVPEPVVAEVASAAAVENSPNNAPPSAAAEVRPGWLTPATLALIAANLIPIAGAVFLGWRLSDVMVLYWAESAAIGFWNLCKILVIGRWLGVFAGLFFLGHFGGFMAVHFLFIYTIFIEGVGPGAAPGGDLADVGHMFLRLWPALLALFVSHGISFFLNFLGHGEYRERTVNKQMSEPYGRIIFMHLVLIFGGGLALVLGDTVPVLLAVIALKIVFDIRAHLKEHAARAAKDFIDQPR